MFLLATYTLAVAVWAVAANFGAPHEIPFRVGGVYLGDKVIHFLVVGLFAVAVGRALWRSGQRPERSLVLGAATAALLCTIEEGLNAFTPHRVCSGFDLLADYLGIATLCSVGWLNGIRSYRFGWQKPFFVRPHGIAM